jgi:hypothetical protein
VIFIEDLYDVSIRCAVQEFEYVRTGREDLSGYLDWFLKSYFGRFIPLIALSERREERKQHYETKECCEHSKDFHGCVSSGIHLPTLLAIPQLTTLRIEVKFLGSGICLAS